MSSNGSKRKAPESGRATKIRKPKRKQQVSDDDEDSNDSGTETQPQPTRTPSPMEELTTKLPEEVLKTFYKPPGCLLIAGCVNWETVAKRESLSPGNNNLYVFQKFTDRKYRLVVSHCSAGHSILIGEDGVAYTFGRNQFGQLGLGDTKTRNEPEPVDALKGMNVIHAAVGRHHSLFVIDTGAVYACGKNDSGQCGVGTTKAMVLVPTRVRHTGAPIVKAGAGAEFSMILDINGQLHSFGLPEYGQLGHNTDGKYFVTSSKLSFYFETVPKHVALYFEKSKDGHITPVKDVAIVDFSCGNNHTVALDSKKRAFSWGFGGFGRLGHAEQKDEQVPRLIKYFETSNRGVRSVHCGATYSLAVNELGTIFLFGQTKRTGEANMYPKPVQDLQGWNIKSVGTSNTSIVVTADDSLIAWGTAPVYGELGLGELAKSSARPKEVTKMEGMNITCIAMGYSHTLLLSDDSVEEVRKKLEQIPTFQVKT